MGVYGYFSGIREHDAARPFQDGGTPGKQTLTQRLPVQRHPAERGGTEPETDKQPDAAELEAATPMESAYEDPFAMHQLVQQRGDGDGDAAPGAVHEAAQEGVAGAGRALPFLDEIQRSFGRHDLGGVRAHVGGPAAAACQRMGASAYATGTQIAFAGVPDLHTAAHEAAHVVQQRSGVQLKGGVGEVGDRYERHADEVADLVVAGQSAEALLDQHAGGSGVSGAPAQARAIQAKFVYDNGVAMTGVGMQAVDPIWRGTTGFGTFVNVFRAETVHPFETWLATNHGGLTEQQRTAVLEAVQADKTRPQAPAPSSGPGGSSSTSGGSAGPGKSPSISSSGAGSKTPSAEDLARAKRWEEEEVIKKAYLGAQKTAVSEYETQMRTAAKWQQVMTYDPETLKSGFGEVPGLGAMLDAAKAKFGADLLIVEGTSTRSNPHSGFISMLKTLTDKIDFAMALMQELSNILARGSIEQLDLAAMGVGTGGKGSISRDNYVALAEEIEYRGMVRRLKSLYEIKGDKVLSDPTYASIKDLIPAMLKESSEQRSGEKASLVFLEYLKRLPSAHKAGHAKRHAALVEYRKQLK